VFGFRGLFDRLTEDFLLGGVLFYSGRTFDAEAPVPETPVPGPRPKRLGPAARVPWPVRWEDAGGEIPRRDNHKHLDALVVPRLPEFALPVE
jgi:hypothetical protein